METEIPDSAAVVPTRYWHKLDDGRVQCDVCPRYCKLHEGQRGLCFVRGNHNGQIVLTTYGRSSGYCVDPIEKKPLNHFLPGTPILSFGTAGCNLACKFCFHPETLVATTRGMKQIADLFENCEKMISVKDGKVGFPRSLAVWTRATKPARVDKVFAHSYSGDLLSLKASSCPPILLTPNHKVFAAHRSNLRDVRLTEAGNLTTDHYLVVPKRHPGGNEIRIDTAEVLAQLKCTPHAPRLRRVPMERLSTTLQATGTSAELGEALGYHPAYVRKLRGQLARGVLAGELPRAVQLQLGPERVRFMQERGAGIPRYLDLTPDLAWVLGFYCAEGSVSSHPGRPNAYQLVFSCGHHEPEWVQKTARLVADLFGQRPVVVIRRTTTTVEIRSTSTARFFEALCGRGAKGKRVPPQLVHASIRVIRSFLDGYFDGDGYLAETHVVGGTVSRELALGLYELGLHFDLLPTFFVHEPAPTKLIEKREVTQATTYIVKFKRDRYEGRKPTVSERTGWRDTGEKFLVPLRQIDRVPYRGRVYNIEVDDPDHSYLAPFLAVSNCQNWDISKSREMDTLMDQASPETIARAARDLKCRSVAYTYNDPVIFMEYAIDVARACREVGVKSVAVTAGYMCDEPRREFYQYMDAANVDLKAFTEEFYWKMTGAHLQPVLDTLKYLKHETGVWFETTTLLIPDLNDSEKEIEEMTQWVVENLGPDVPMHFSAFHPDWKMRDIPPTPAATLIRARAIAMKNGVRYAYTGNVHNETGDSTWCHHCGARLIGRDWYKLTAWNLDAQGKCKACGTPCAGVFEAEPGDWGARRLPVRLANFAA